MLSFRTLNRLAQLIVDISLGEKQTEVIFNINLLIQVQR